MWRVFSGGWINKVALAKCAGALQNLHDGILRRNQLNHAVLLYLYLVLCALYLVSSHTKYKVPSAKFIFARESIHQWQHVRLAAVDRAVNHPAKTRLKTT